VRNGRAFAIDGNRYFNRSGPRLVESAEILASLLFAKDMADGIDHTSWQNIADNNPNSQWTGHVTTLQKNNFK
jgi:hypothetical protein